MNSIRGSVAALVFCSGLVGCGTSNPQSYLVGQWKGDTSEAAIAERVSELTAKWPDMPDSEALDAARAVAAVSVELRADGTADIDTGTYEWKGSWTYDPESNLVEFKVARAAMPQEEESPVAEWTGELDMDARTLTVVPMPRTLFDMLKSTGTEPGSEAFPGFELRKP